MGQDVVLVNIPAGFIRILAVLHHDNFVHQLVTPAKSLSQFLPAVLTLVTSSSHLCPACHTCYQVVTQGNSWSHLAPGSHTLHLMSARRPMPARRSMPAWRSMPAQRSMPARRPSGNLLPHCRYRLVAGRMHIGTIHE